MRRTAGYLLMTLLGSVILVVAAMSHLVAACASHLLAQHASPGYNSTWEWIGQELEVLIRGTSAYIIVGYLTGVAGFFYTYCAYILLTNIWILLRCCLLKVTSPCDLRSGLIMWALIAHFRRIIVLFVFLVSSVLVVYPLVLLRVPCVTGIMLAQLFSLAAPTCWNIFLCRQYRVIMGLPDSEVSADTMDKKELNRRFKKVGLPSI